MRLIKIEIRIVMGLIAILITGVAAMNPSIGPNGFKNLKVLPKDISNKALQQIMVDEFQDGLGVGCNYCHVREEGSLHLDYAKDEKPEKEIARKMMQMTMEINKNYFGVANPVIGDSTLTITCISCHQGIAHPDHTD